MISQTDGHLMALNGGSKRLTKYELQYSTNGHCLWQLFSHYWAAIVCIKFSILTVCIFTCLPRLISVFIDFYSAT